jgi:hypothetical protein
MEKYTGMTLKDLGDGRWQARFSYKDGDRWKWKSRNFRAPSERAARREAAARRAELEEEAAREALPLGMGDDELLLPRFLEAYIRGSEAGGGIEPTTATNYRHAAAHICRHLSSWRVDELTPQAILAMQ